MVHAQETLGNLEQPCTAKCSAVPVASPIFFEMTRGTRRCLICIKGCARAYKLRARMRDLLNSSQICL